MVKAVILISRYSIQVYVQAPNITLRKGNTSHTATGNTKQPQQSDDKNAPIQTKATRNVKSSLNLPWAFY